MNCKNYLFILWDVSFSRPDVRLCMDFIKKEKEIKVWSLILVSTMSWKFFCPIPNFILKFFFLLLISHAYYKSVPDVSCELESVTLNRKLHSCFQSKVMEYF